MTTAGNNLNQILASLPMTSVTDPDGRGPRPDKVNRDDVIKALPELREEIKKLGESLAVIEAAERRNRGAKSNP